MPGPLEQLRALLDEPQPRQRMALPRIETFDLEGAGPTIVPHPPQFQPQPEAVGQPLGQGIDALLKIAPSLQGMIRHVQYGPSEDVARVINRSNQHVLETGDGKIFAPEDFKDTNLLGLTNIGTKDISINPRVGNPYSPLGRNIYVQNEAPSDESLMAVLGHEATHAAGYPGEAQPREAGNIFSTLGRTPASVLEGLKSALAK